MYLFYLFLIYALHNSLNLHKYYYCSKIGSTIVSMIRNNKKLIVFQIQDATMNRLLFFILILDYLENSNSVQTVK